MRRSSSFAELCRPPPRDAYAPLLIGVNRFSLKGAGLCLIVSIMMLSRGSLASS